MIVNSLNLGLSFGRALTTKEKKDFKEITEQARQALRLGDTTATVFDFCFPTAEKDTGVGTSFSADAQEMVQMLKTMCGVNSIQFGPQGEVSNYVRSPYSGTNFSLGSHLVDLTKLQGKEYGELLSDQELQAPFFNRVSKDNVVDYDNIYAQDGQEKMLKTAYSRFDNLPATHPLKCEYEQFEKENSYWLERDALFEAAVVANGIRDIAQWPYRDQNVFATPQGDGQRIQELKKVTDNESLNVVDYNKFVQFIADKQQKESKAKFNQQGIKIYGDSQIGFSQKDFWAHKSAFSENYEFGCDIGNNKYSCWSPAIDFNKLKGEAGELLYKKFDLFFKRYDGARIDAAWQYVKPLVCEPQNKRDGSSVFDENGNKLGNKIKNQPQIPNNGEYIMKNIILKAADDNGVPHNQIFLELLGGNSYDSLDAVKNTGMTLIHISRYASDSWGRAKYYETSAPNSKYQNMRPGDYTFGPGTHDDITAIEQSKDANRAKFFARDLKLNESELKQSPIARLKAIFAELFTTKNQFATINDIFGSNVRINTPNTIDGNWSYRTGKNYEENYHKALKQGKGLNYADALATALKAKNAPRYLIDSLEKYSRILQEDGPMTTKDADKIYA